jgi:sugar phosphate isomerase/epimerase
MAAYEAFERNDGVVEGETRQYYHDFIQAMRGNGYQGYISYELCQWKDRGVEFADMNAQLAAEFKRRLIRPQESKN